jgi:DNA gyrase inhibitor GyrI
LFKALLNKQWLKKQWLPFLLAFVFPLVGVYWWWGGFNSAVIGKGESGPYFYAYLEHVGDLGKLPKTQGKVHALLKQAGVEPGETITLLLSDPRTTRKSDQRARTGYRVSVDVKLPAELSSEIIPRRKVLFASVHAGTMLAPGKAYQALHEHLQSQGRTLQMPALEIYRPSGTPAKVGELIVEVAAE